MHATLRQDRVAESGRAIRGTFYPGDESRGGGSIGSVVPKLLAILVAMAVVRTVIGAKRQHGGPSRRSRRREAIAEFHRELHAEDSPAPPAGSTGRGGEATTRA
jgi:hypothetical protein